MRDAFDIGRSLAKTLRDKPWYHNTTVCDRRSEETGRSFTFLEVWGEYEHGKRPDDAPNAFDGMVVVFNRVTPQHECPFGSVKEKTRSKREQDRKEPIG